VDTLERIETTAPAEEAVPPPTVVQALARVMADVQSVKKTGHNAHDNYNFRGIDQVVNAVGPVLREHGVVTLPLLQDITYRDTQTSTGKATREVNVKVTYRFVGPAGDHLDVTVPGEALDRGDKGTAKAMSVAYRIALLQVLCIPTDEPDPDEASYERGSSGREHSPRPQSARSEFRPSAEAQELMASVNAAAHTGAMGRVWARVVSGVKTGAITEAEGRWLRARAEERGPELPPDPDAPQAAAETTQDTPAALEGELIENGTPE
jgi:hypothetical protein